MLITSPSQFGDHGLDPKEALAKAKEETGKMLEGRKYYQQPELEDVERSSGSHMAYQEVLRRIWKEVPQLVVKDGSAGSVALYYPVVNEEGIREERYVGGFPQQPLPEYSHLTLDERGLAKREVRGWRSVLISLIKAGVLSYRQAVRQFGEANGSRAWRWREQLQQYK